MKKTGRRKERQPEGKKERQKEGKKDDRKDRTGRR
jgi:hypothetical protein